MVISKSPIFCEPPLPIGQVSCSKPLLSTHRHVSKTAAIFGLCCLAKPEDRPGDRYARESGKWDPAAPFFSELPHRRDSSSPTDRSKQPGPRASSAKTCCGQNR